MSNVGSQKVLTGGTPSAEFGHPITVYVIPYGHNWGSPNNTYLQNHILYLLESLAESSYTAMIPLYTGTGGTAASGDLYYGPWYYDQSTQGTSLTDSAIQKVISNFITKLDSSPDPNGIYLVLPDDNTTYSDNVGKKYCTDECGYNNYATISGQTLHYAVVGDSLSCPTKCGWGMITPNNNNGTDFNGVYDFELNAIAHELSEAVTDPYSSSGGWYANNPSNPNYDQEADMCAGQTGTTYTYQQNVGSLFFDVTANFHGVSGDFLLQPQRVNANNGSFGYCANSYGGVFSGKNFGLRFSPFSGAAWAPVNGYSGECPPGQPISGLSANNSGGPAHSVLCGSGSDYNDFVEGSNSSCHVVDFGLPTGAHNNQMYTDPTDWASGFYKGECYQNEYVAGVAQATNGEVSALLCCNGNVTHGSCSASAIGSFTPHYDWAFGYYKATCGDGQYVAGVSASETTGMANNVLCCTP